MDVNDHTKFVILLTFASVLAMLTPDTAAMAQTVPAVQDIATMHPTVIKGNDSGSGITDSIWLILLALGGFLYLINNRSV